MMKRTIRSLGMGLGCMLLALCTGGCMMEKNEEIKLSYDNEIPEGGIKDNGDYNQALFYRNDALLDNPDPQITYVTDKDSTEYGYFYLYGTNMSSDGFKTYRSKDLQNWQDVSALVGHYAFVPSENCLAQSSFWAPEVIYDEDSDQYYMFYSGSPGYDDGVINDRSNYTCLAVSDEPYGPFIPCTENGLDETKVLIDADKANAAVAKEDQGPWGNIDASPFVGADGEKYLLFTRSKDVGDDGISTLWGMRMNSWSDPDYSTLTRLTRNGYLTTERTEEASYESKRQRNEAPHMYVRENEDGTATYYLTFSINDRNDYTVIQAIGDSPLGPYTKLKEEEGGVLLANEGLVWDHVKGPGHHCFIEVEGELYVFYHQQANRTLGNSWIRTLTKDRIKFTENENGQTVMVANGPTWSLQPQLKVASEYSNIASEATVSVTSGENKEALTDGLLSIYKAINFVKEFEIKKTSTITLDFGEYREITGIMIYNSKWFEKAFLQVDRVEFDFKNEEVPDGATAYIDNLEFDWNSYKNASIDDMRPGGSAVAVFAPMQVKSIRITFKLPIDRPDNLQLLDSDGYVMRQETIGISEIAVLGK